MSEATARTARSHEGQTSRELPKYKSHKDVWALKIAALENNGDGGLTVTPADEGYGPYKVEAKFVPKHEPGRPEVGWYLVIYKNGYTSFSPADAFEEGYTRV